MAGGGALERPFSPFDEGGVGGVYPTFLLSEIFSFFGDDDGARDNPANKSFPGDAIGSDYR